MSKPQVGSLVYTDKGAGRIEKVFYGIITKLIPSKKRYVICTVVLNTPYEDKHKHKVTRIEAEVPYQRSKTYEHLASGQVEPLHQALGQDAEDMATAVLASGGSEGGGVQR